MAAPVSTALLLLLLAAAASSQQLGIEPTGPQLHPFRPSPSHTGLSSDPPCPAPRFAVELPGGPLPDALGTVLSDISTQLATGLNTTNLPGVALLVSRSSRTLTAFGAGVANKSSASPMAMGTLTRIGSVSKAFACTLLFRLAAEGVVHLDTTVASLLPGFDVKNPWDSASPRGAGITLRHLASHTSGLQREAPYPAATTAEVVTALQYLYLVRPPGSQPSYSNLGVALLAHILGEVVAPVCGGAADCFPYLVEKYITGPLGMKDTGFNYTPGVLSRLAVGYLADGSAAPFADLRWVYPAGSMYSSVADLVAFGSGLLAAFRGEYTPLGLPAASARALLSPTYWNPTGASLWGAPWEIRVNNGTLVYNKGGNLGGYSTVLAVTPEADTVVAVAWNGGADETTVSDSLHGALLPVLAAVLAPFAPSPPAIPGPYASSVIGVFTNPQTGGTLTTLMYEGMLLMRIADGVNLGLFLDYFAPGSTGAKNGILMFRMYVPPSAIPCVEGEMLAADGQYVRFSMGADGRVVEASAGGMFPGYGWQPAA